MSLPRLLLLSLLAGNVLLRFFTNDLGALPRVLNLWDVFLTLALILLAFGAPVPSHLPVDRRKIVRWLVGFNIICVVGSLLNHSHVYWLAVVSQMIMWNEPVLLFLAIIRLPLSVDDILKFRRFLLFLVGFEVFLGLCQVPAAIRLSSSEEIIGTFKGNAEQLQFFILIAVFYALAELHVRKDRKKSLYFVIFLILALVVLIDNKASWVALAITFIVLVPKLPALQAQNSSRIKGYAFLGVLLLFGYSLIRLSSDTAGAKFGQLAEGIRSGNILNLGKVKAVRDVLSAYGKYPQMALVGSGCGTFYSRASFQFFPFHISEMYQNEFAVGSGEFVAGSASMQGVINPVSGIRAFYKQFYEYEKIYPVGSGTADFPTSSYTSLLGETGLIGTTLYLGIVFLVLRSHRDILRSLRSDREFFSFAAAAFALFIYLMLMGTYNFWLDCGRVNTIAWSLLGLTVRYAFLRQQEPEVSSAVYDTVEELGVLGKT